MVNNIKKVEFFQDLLPLYFPRGEGDTGMKYVIIIIYNLVEDYKQIQTISKKKK